MPRSLKLLVLALALALASSALGSDSADVTIVVSDAPPADSPITLKLVGRGERLLSNATSDVWVHQGFAYLGTSDPPCGDGTVGDAGIQVFDVHDPHDPQHVAALPSVAGSRINDLKVARLTGGDLLVHGNERCSRNGSGGFEIYDIGDPLAPRHLGHVATRSINPLVRQERVGEEGVHNLVLFTRDGRDYVGSQVNTDLGAFQIFDITDPSSPELIGHFGAESVPWPEIDWAAERDESRIQEAIAYLGSGFGQIANRSLHDLFVTPDGLTAYLAHWDAGLIRLDLSELSRPRLVSVAIDSALEDGEVSSHSVWPDASGRVVVEGEEDFHARETYLDITDGGDLGRNRAVQGTAVTPLASLPGQGLTGATIFVGRGCDGVPEATAPGAIALFERGVCTFMAKVRTARQAGYAGVVIFNHADGGEALVPMGGTSGGLPGVFVARSVGLTVARVETDAELAVGDAGLSVRIANAVGGYGGLRIWDYSDPEAPQLASVFNTRCSALPDDAGCPERGLTTAHNLIVEGTRAYISWYGEGILVLDISDPYQPVELARFRGDGSIFRSSNGGPQQMWGIYKLPGEPFLYASDRNGGLYVLEVLDRSR